MEWTFVIASFLDELFSPAALQDFSYKFLSVLFEGLPFIFIGTLISGFIDVYMPASLMDRLLPKNKLLSILTCGLLGLIIPVCECTVVPVIRRLVGKGLPVGSAFTYMLAAPIVNPITLMSTYTAFDGEMAVSRMLLGYLVAVVVGLLVIFLPIEKILKKSVLERLNFSGKGQSEPAAVATTTGDHHHTSPSHLHAEEDHACCSSEKHSCGHDHEASSHHDHTCSSHDVADCCDHHHGANNAKDDDRLVSAMRVAMRDFIDVTVYFIIGVSLVTLLKDVISSEGNWVSSLAEGGEIQASAFMMSLAFVLSLCSTSDAFVVATSFGEKFGHTSKMAFMVFGPMMDVKLIFLYQTLMRWKAVLLMLVTLFIIVGAACVVWGDLYAIWMARMAEG